MTAPALHEMLARRIAELELAGRGAEQHQVWTRLESLLRPPGEGWFVGFTAAADLVALARAEQAARGERPAPNLPAVAGV